MIILFSGKTERENEEGSASERCGENKRKEIAAESIQDKAVNNNFSPIIKYMFLLYMQTHTCLYIYLYM